MDYIHFTSNDFALDEKFQQWVLNPDADNDRFWNDWIKQHPEKQKEITEAIDLVRLAGLSADHEANTKFLRIWENLSTHAQGTEQMHRTKVTFRYARIAAVWVGLALLTTYLLWNTVQTSDATEYKTSYGETREVILNDGSTVTLNANSYMRLSDEDWSQQAIREVFLEGEAFFSITHQTNQQRFVVHTDNVQVEVLGTEFNVNSRDATTRVVLNKGKVKLNIAPLADEGEVVMTPGELVEFSETERKFTKKMVDVEVYTSWRNRELVFRETALAEIARVLENSYGLEIQLDSTLADKEFTGTFPSDKLSVLLKAIAEVHGARITRNGQKIIINKK